MALRGTSRNGSPRRRRGLRYVRKKRGLTQVQLAAKSGVTQTYISWLESQPYPNPTWRTVDALCRALRARPYDLFPLPAPLSVSGGQVAV